VSPTDGTRGNLREVPWMGPRATDENPQGARSDKLDRTTRVEPFNSYFEAARARAMVAWSACSGEAHFGDAGLTYRWKGPTVSADAYEGQSSACLGVQPAQVAFRRRPIKGLCSRVLSPAIGRSPHFEAPPRTKQRIRNNIRYSPMAHSSIKASCLKPLRAARRCRHRLGCRMR
jgi:hypothetical protein